MFTNKKSIHKKLLFFVLCAFRCNGNC